MNLRIEDELSSILESGVQSPEQAARELIVLELFRQGRISGGRAAELLCVSREEFIHRSSELGIPYIDLDPDELNQEIAEAAALTVDNGR